MSDEADSAKPLYVAVIGPSAAGQELCDLAREAGAELARLGTVVVIGSVLGVSGAAARGAAAEGGTVVALLPGYTRPVDDLPAEVLRIPTGLGELCNGLVVRAADAVLSVGGGWGTLIEVATAQRTEVPVVSLSGWRISDAAGMPTVGPDQARTVVEAVEKARAAARIRRADDAGRIG